MALKLGRIISEANRLWPESLADDWDAPGLVVGDLEHDVERVLLTVDVTKSVLDEAIERNCQLIIAHHPLLLRGVKSIAFGMPKGDVLSTAIRTDISIFSAHTNADIVQRGVSDMLARNLGLKNVKPLVPSGVEGIGHGRIGELDREVSLGELAVALGRLLPPTASGVRVAGDYEKKVRRVALCAGAGDSFIAEASNSGADVYITSDLRHHPVQESRELNRSLNIIDISHWASESLWLPEAKSQLAELLPELDFIVSEVRSDPWDFTVTQ